MEFLQWPVVQILLGFVALIVGGELLVRGASQMAAAFRISPLVIGLTVVAFGTSAPELAVSLQSAYAGNTDIAVGNVVGSNIINVLCILGLSAVITPLVVSSQLIRRELPVMVIASVAMLLVGLDGNISRIDGCLMFGALMVFIVWSIRASRRENLQLQAEAEREGTELTQAENSGLFVQLGLIVAGLVLLGLGADWLVGGAVIIATRFGVSELVIGLTIVAGGTSLPEVVTSVMAALRGEREIAVGNVVGSNLFNILCVLGLSSIFAPAGIGVSDAAIQFDIPIMIAVAVVCLPVFFSGNLIARWEGGLFLFYYFAYTAYLVLEAVGNDFSRTLGAAMVYFVLPLTVIVLTVSTLRSMKPARESA